MTTRQMGVTSQPTDRGLHLWPSGARVLKNYQPATAGPLGVSSEMARRVHLGANAFYTFAVQVNDLSCVHAASYYTHIQAPARLHTRAGTYANG